MRRMPLSTRLSLLFAALLVTYGGFSAWLQISNCIQHDLEVVQGVSRDLASRLVAQHPGLKSADPAAVRELYSQLRSSNPTVEAYILDGQGRILETGQSDQALPRDRVELAPIRQMLDGAALPLKADDPLSVNERKVFSVAPLDPARPDAGYLYVVLLGQQYSAMARDISLNRAWNQLIYSVGFIGVLGVLGACLAFVWITRPMRRLTETIRHLDGQSLAAGLPRAAATPESRDEVTVLSQTFADMSERITQQWQTLSQRDREHRELVANISHDLRTPLTSLHGYLETLAIKDLDEEHRRRYLEIALAQSAKVGRLAQELFELARLEYGAVKLEPERFSLAELVQDVLQKFELAAQSRELSLRVETAADLPPVRADLGLIERVLTNLLDNAIRHTPAGGEIRVRLWNDHGRVGVQVIDSGQGVPEELRASLFQRPTMPSRDGRESGGLGLIFVRRILELHGSDIRLRDRPGQGSIFEFGVPCG